MEIPEHHFPNGFAISGPPRAVGTIIDQHRSGGVRAIRQKIEKLPALSIALSWLISEVVREGRRDLKTRVNDLAMEPDGSLVHRNGSITPFWLTAKALDQLLKLMEAPPHAGSYLAAIPTHRRAVEVNSILRHNGNQDRPVVLRLRQGQEGFDNHEVFSVVTPRYTPIDPDTIARRLLDVAESDGQLAKSKTEVIYTGERTSIRLYQESNVATNQLGIDEAFASVLGLMLGDDKMQGIHVDLSALRSACLNLMLVKADSQGLFRARHLGDRHQLTHQILQAVTCGADLLPEFMKTYQAAAKVMVEDPVLVIEHLTGGLTGKKTGSQIQVAGVKPRMLTDRVIDAWHQESDPTQKGICNALTKAAHTYRWPSIWTSRDLERQASLLLATPEPRFRRLIDIPPEHVQVPAHAA